MNDFNEAHKQIEDVIDARIESGHFDMLFNKSNRTQVNTRYVYSAHAYRMDDVCGGNEFPTYNLQGDNNNDNRCTNLNSIGQTDSEITLVRVKREGSQYRTQINNWDMHDDAIPGDGTHLGESPSLVNLVTLVIPSKHCLKSNNQHEYMIPLSSWEPVEAEPEPVLCNDIGECSTGGKVPHLVTQKSNSNLKDIFKCFMFWKQKNSIDKE